MTGVRLVGPRTPLYVAIERAIPADGHSTVFLPPTDAAHTHALTHWLRSTNADNHAVVCSDVRVYATGPHLPNVIVEDHPLRTDVGPTFLGAFDRAAHDASVSADGPRVTLLRFAHRLASLTDSCPDATRATRQPGFDPMVQVISDDDAAVAVRRAVERRVNGVYNIPGTETLPLSHAFKRLGRTLVPVPNIIGRLWGAPRAGVPFGQVLDGKRALADLEYAPSHPVRWPCSPPRPTSR